MSRVQLALNVSDVDAAVEFYSRLFGVGPAKRRPGYANFAIDEPALKLVLIENTVAPATLNHLGVEVGSSGDVASAQARLAGVGLETATEEGVSCCYAVQDKVWVSDPDGAPWEIYTVLADGDTMGRSAVGNEGDVCCAGATATGASSETEGEPTQKPTAIGCC
ncbi:MAG TPA: ArsI/CadI family heavy metal resistance metalloenzyme [Acidimicrobiia bacterium]|jgi:catechol 2,3-dioxygenase-like lactoylglutathione lyase family enzyme|nr:ArsI/CadI family heavy metal resistance metalloenzyme [Acidimicrobiia bacterium]